MTPEPDVWPCETNADCLDGDVCRTALDGSQECRPENYCDFNSDCHGPLQQCLAKLCTQVECTPLEPTACGAYACNGITCRTQCTYQSDCATGNTCVDSECVLAQCDLMNAAEVCGSYACIDSSCRTACDTDGDCAASFACDAGECKPALLPLDAYCGEDSQCQSGLCCPRVAPGVSICAEACTRLVGGDECEWNEICDSRNCQDGVCAPCTDAGCVQATCAAVECGVHEGIDCGGCDGTAYCSNNNCLTPCADRECGTDNGVDCGSCPGPTEYCGVAGDCLDACANRECGEFAGIECGTCDAQFICVGHQCITPVCPPAQSTFCIDGDVYECHDGAEYVLVADCADGQWCREDFDTCQSYSCEPGVQCNPAYESTGACEQVVAGSNSAVGNVYAVDTDVWLTQFAQHFTPYSVNELHWFVYESASAGGPYTEFVGVNAVPYDFDAPIYSPVFVDLELRAGYFYIIGVAAPMSFDYCIDPDAAQDDLTFGTRIGSYYSASGLPGIINNPDGVGATYQELNTLIDL